MSACAVCGHARQLDGDGLVEPHEALAVDYEAQVVARLPCEGAGQPPKAQGSPPDEVPCQLALFVDVPQ